MERGEVRLKNESLAVLDPYLVVRGVPLPPGAVRDPKGVSVTDADGRVLPSEGKVLQLRPDGSIEWLFMDILVKLGGQEECSIFIEPAGARRPRVRHPVKLEDDGRQITLSNGLSGAFTDDDAAYLADLELNVLGREVPDSAVALGVAAMAGAWWWFGRSKPTQLSGGYRVVRRCFKYKTVRGRRTCARYKRVMVAG